MEKLKILLIDDEVDFLKIMTVRIKSWGYDMVSADSGRKGLDMFKNEKPGIIVLDYIMPEMDGIATLKEIRKIDAQIPVIMFTAHPDVKVIEGTENLGVSAFIPKVSISSEGQSLFSLKLAIDKAINL